jgi:signal transduction histidine kinase
MLMTSFNPRFPMNRPDVAGWTRRLAFALLCWLSCVAPLPAHAQPLVDPARITMLVDAQLCVPGGIHDALPGPECAWKPVQLPRLARGPRENPINDAWFKVTFRLDAVPSEGLVLYTDRFQRTGRVFVNSAQVRALGSMVEPMPQNWNRSQFLALPAALLRPGLNELEIQTRNYAWNAMALGRLRLGPDALLRPVWERKVFWQNDIVELGGIVTATLGVILFGVWAFRRSEAAYFWFACACAVWTTNNLDFYVDYPPLPAFTWESFVLITNGLRGPVMWMFILRYGGWRRPRLEAAFWLYFIAGAIGLVVDPFGWSWIDFWYVGSMLTGLYFVWLVFRAGMQRSLLQGVLLGFAGSLDSALSVYDIVQYASQAPERVFLAHYAALVYVLVVGAVLIGHFVASMTGHERQLALTQQALGDVQRATKEKNLFFSMVSHELKSPLQSIITVLATEDKRAEGRERRLSLKKISRAVRHMEAQIRDLYVLSLGEAGKLEMRAETFEVGDLVDELLATVSDLASAKQLRLEVTRPDDLLFVATDPKRVEQILLNLLENAIKYTAAGSVTIAYGLEDGPTLRISVADTGVGIAREHIDQLFVPYRRFGLIDREHNSLGIGLAVVQTLLTHLGGACVVDSTPGAGSTFTVRLPVALEKDEPAGELSPDAVQILIVDDRPDMLGDLRDVAQLLGYHVDVAGSAPVASNQLAVAAYDVVLIDLDMPVKNGIELASETRRGDGPNSRTCLVAVSAGDPRAHGIDTSDAARLWPFDSYEQKPLDERAMKRIVETRTRR